MSKIKLNALSHFCLTYTHAGYGGNFGVLGGTTTQGLPYDFNSIMHLRHNVFSCEKRYRSTVLPRNLTIPNRMLGISRTGTSFDFLHINLLYCQGMVLLRM